MFSFARKIVATAMALAMTVGMSATALADEAKAIQVQVNGVSLATGSSAPVMKGGSVFVPMRAIFEGLGAEVSYDDATATVSASRGNQTVSFVIGDKELKVATDGQERTLSTENPSFEEKGVTYVPVRFIADALGAKVEWDSTAQTAIILDTAKIKADLEGKFTVMDKYMAYNKSFASRALKFTGTMDYDMKVSDGTDTIPMKLTGTISGISESDKMNMKMALKMNPDDLKTLLDQAGAADENPEEVKLVTDVLNNLTTEVIMDMNTGKFYIAMPAIASLLGGEKNTWYEIDFNALFAEAGMPGMNMAQLMQMNKTDSFVEAIVEIANIMPIQTKETGEAFASMLDTYVKCFSDEAFKPVDGGYKTTYTMTEAGATTTMDIQLTEADDQITGYTMDVSASVPGAGEMKITASQAGDDCKVSMDFNVPNFLTMVFKSEMKYTDTTDKALSKPANGAKIISFNDMLNGVGTPEAPATAVEPTTEAPAPDEPTNNESPAEDTAA